MMWDTDAECTNAIMQDVGVSLLTADEKTGDRRQTTESSHSATESVQSHVS